MVSTPQTNLKDASGTIKPADIGAQGKREYSRQNPATGQPTSRGTRYA